MDLSKLEPQHLAVTDLSLSYINNMADGARFAIKHPHPSIPTVPAVRKALQDIARDATKALADLDTAIASKPAVTPGT